jgi:surface polysaccharide O-acyltransferase-like enzyme
MSQSSELKVSIIEEKSKPKRYFGIDLIRVLSCYFVMQIHAGEYYYVGINGRAITGRGCFWNGIYNSLTRISVPLFVMISGYLLLPLKTDIPTFLKRRMTRVVFPFLFWCSCFSFYFYFRKKCQLKDAFINLIMIFVNFGTEVGHLWYIYMIIGIYLFAPIISPWIKTAPAGQFYYFFALWAITNLIVYIHIKFKYIWGECFWNNTPMLHNFTGHTGYAVLGAFIKIHLHDKNYYILGAVLIVVGWAVTYAIFEIQRRRHVEWCYQLEYSWSFHSLNVVAAALGFFLLFRKIECSNEKISKLISDIALKSYGMFLCHIMILDLFHYLIDPQNIYAYFSIPTMAICTFIATYLVVKLISYIPYSQYIIG